MAKFKTPIHTAGSEGIAKNSLSIAFGDPVAIKSGFINKAVAGDKIVGHSTETKDFASDNQTVAQATLQYIETSDLTIMEYTVENGTISQSAVGTTFNLTSNSIVDGATSGTGTQLILKKVLSTTKGDFIMVNYNVLPHNHVDQVYATGTVSVQAANGTLVAGDFNKIITNTGASGAITLTLPAASAVTGKYLKITALVAQIINLSPISTDKIYLNGSGVANKDLILAGTIGTTATIYSDGTQYLVLSHTSGVTKEA